MLNRLSRRRLTLTFQPSKQVYSGKIREVTLGSGDKAVTIGGRGVYSFHSFEGAIPNAPRIAMEVWDKDPSEDWAEAAKAPFSGVLERSGGLGAQVRTGLRGRDNRGPDEKRRSER